MKFSREIASTFITAALLFLFSPAFAGEFYKWTDDNGVIHFSDSLHGVPPKYRNQIKTENLRGFTSKSDSATGQAADLEEAEIALSAGDYAKALLLLKPLAEQGVARAQHHVGTIYTNGDGTDKDDEEAKKWFHRAAEQVLAQTAQNHLLNKSETLSRIPLSEKMNLLPKELSLLLRGEARMTQRTGDLSATVPVSGMMDIECYKTLDNSVISVHSSIQESDIIASYIRSVVTDKIKEGGYTLVDHQESQAGVATVLIPFQPESERIAWELIVVVFDREKGNNILKDSPETRGLPLVLQAAVSISVATLYPELDSDQRRLTDNENLIVLKKLLDSAVSLRSSTLAPSRGQASSCSHNRIWWADRIKHWKNKKEEASQALQEGEREFRGIGLKNIPRHTRLAEEERVRRKIQSIRNAIKEIDVMIHKTLPEEARKEGVPPGWLR